MLPFFYYFILSFFFIIFHYYLWNNYFYLEFIGIKKFLKFKILAYKLIKNNDTANLYEPDKNLTHSL